MASKLKPDKIDPALKIAHEYLYTLIRPKPVKKKQNCLSCHKSFLSKGPFNHMCGSCRQLSKAQYKYN